MFPLQLAIDPELRGALEELYRRRWILECLRAQREADTMPREAREAKAVDGLGALESRIPGTAYHAWGQRLGYDCWNDPGFRRDFRKMAPETVVRCYGTRTQVPVAWERPEQPRELRFRKIYPNCRSLDVEANKP